MGSELEILRLPLDLGAVGGRCPPPHVADSQTRTGYQPVLP